MDDERTLQNETKKIKWILVSKTKNLERIKDELSDITETNKRLEQACNEHHNALRNALDEENEVHEINTKKLKEINVRQFVVDNSGYYSGLRKPWKHLCEPQEHFHCR